MALTVSLRAVSLTLVDPLQAISVASSPSYEVFTTCRVSGAAKSGPTKRISGQDSPILPSVEGEQQDTYHTW